MQERVYRKNIRDVSELRERIIESCNQLDQSIIDCAIRQWHTRLQTCVKEMVDISSTTLTFQFSNDRV